MKLGPRCYKQTSSSIFLTTQDETQLFIVHVTNSTVLFQHHSLPLERCSLEFHKMWWLSSHQIHSVYTCQNLLSLRVPLGPATHCLVLDLCKVNTIICDFNIIMKQRDHAFNWHLLFFQGKKIKLIEVEEAFVAIKVFYRDMCVCI